MSMKVITTVTKLMTTTENGKMTKDELKRYAISRLNTLHGELEDWGDVDDLIMNAADGGNHNDTFTTGEGYGWIQGQIKELELLLKILEETPNVEHPTN